MLQYRGHACFESVRPDIILRLLQYLKLNNLLYDNIEEDVKIIPSFLVEEKRCDSLPLVALKNTNIEDKIPVIVEKNYSIGAEAKGILLSIPNNTSTPILLENCEITHYIKILGWCPARSVLHHEEKVPL